MLTSTGQDKLPHGPTRSTSDQWLDSPWERYFGPPGRNVAVLNDSRSSFSAARELLAVPSHPSPFKGNSISCAALEIEIVLPSSFLAPTLARRAFGPWWAFACDVFVRPWIAGRCCCTL